MNRFRRLVAFLTLVAAVLWLYSPPQFAQTTVTSTTLSTAVNNQLQQIAVASVTGFDVGDIAFVDREAMLVRSVNSSALIIGVQRGWEGTIAQAHGASAPVFIGAPSNYYQGPTPPVGICTATAENFLPRIMLPSGDVYTCAGSALGAYWQKIGADLGTVTQQFVQGGVAANAVDTAFFIADRTYVVTKIQAVWAVAESTGSMDIMVEKLTGTTACASGTDLQTAAIAGTGAAQTVATATLTATPANLLVAAGDRLCVDLTATPNEISQLVVTAQLTPR